MALTLPDDLPQLRALWHDAPDDDDVMTVYVQVAERDCVAWAPVDFGPQDATNPSWLLAVALQAQARAKLGQQGEGEQIGIDGQTLRVRPVTDAVKTILRPPSPVPVTG